MMDDRTLLERAAKAAGYDAKWRNHFYEPFRGFEVNGSSWNPLTDDGDALRLAVKLRLTIDHKEECVNVWDGCFGTGFIPNEGDPYAATRRAIVRAAAEIGGE